MKDLSLKKRRARRTILNMGLVIMAALILPTLSSVAQAATGDFVGGVNFSVQCESGVGVGITYDGQNLWYSCYDDKTDLYRADPKTGIVSASYSIRGGLGALAYDAGRNVIWAGWGSPRINWSIYKIQLDGAKNVIGSTFAFVPITNSMSIDDGLAYDATDDTLYVSPDVSSTIYHYAINGTLLGSFLKAPGPSCGNSGLALGGSLLYEGFNGCSEVVMVDKASPSTVVFNFSTIVAGDPNFRDEGLTCDPNTFSPLDVMWSKEAYSPMRAHAYEIPAGSCEFGGGFHKGKITGGGWISIPGDPKATFGIVGQYPDSKNTAQGDVEYQDHVAGLNIKSTEIDSVATSLDNKKGVITGMAMVNNAGPYSFVVYVEDNGEPGKGVDVFKISVASPTPYTNGAVLSSGNIQIHS